MSRLLWDQVGERFYETGLDRGVLYLSDGSGVAWSGLIDVEENFNEDEATPTHFDGVKTSDTPAFGNYSAELTAFVYPDEFMEYEGTASVGNGLYVSNQEPKTFGLSYRSRIGNDVDGTAHGYKIHVLYNLMVSPNPVSRNTLGDTADPVNFTWEITSLPEQAPGYRPTAHVILDSRYLSRGRLQSVESLLYGDESENPRLPPLSELIDRVLFWEPKGIETDEVSGLNPLVDTTPENGDLTQINIEGLYVSLPTSRFHPSGVDGIYNIEE